MHPKEARPLKPEERYKRAVDALQGESVRAFEFVRGPFETAVVRASKNIPGAVELQCCGREEGLFFFRVNPDGSYEVELKSGVKFDGPDEELVDRVLRGWPDSVRLTGDAARHNEIITRYFSDVARSPYLLQADDGWSVVLPERAATPGEKKEFMDLLNGYEFLASAGDDTVALTGKKVEVLLGCDNIPGEEDLVLTVTPVEANSRDDSVHVLFGRYLLQLIDTGTGLVTAEVKSLAGGSVRVHGVKEGGHYRLKLLKLDED
ncbi:MAG: hypothetical protein D6719_09525 [Candidatus Dadabacteria bacterium]|nr:MAG: hypothetical protein D6719_09525 [Candidatus Dadabacteria bacterium]